MISCRELRRRARGALGNSIFNGSWLFALLACVVVSLITSVLSSTGVLAPLTFIIYGCLQFGLCSFFLKSIRGSEDKDDLNTLFTGFTENLGRNIIAGILIQIFTFLWALLFIIPGIVMAYAYSMTFYIMRDNPNMSALDAIKASKKMMRGYKMKAFLLTLSFLGWIFVGVFCCCGIGMLWVTPYMQASHAELYEHIKSNSEDTYYSEY